MKDPKTRLIRKLRSNLSSINYPLSTSSGFTLAPFMSNLNTKIGAFSKTGSTFRTYSKNNGAGFTLIELLVVITMVGMVSGIGVFSLVNYGNSQTLEQSVSNIKGIFDEAKFNALSSVIRGFDADGIAISCTDNISSYRVDIIPSTLTQDSVELYMECGSSDNLVESYVLPESLNIGVDTTCDEVTYQVITLEASALPLLPCVVSVEGFNQIKALTIDSIGNLNIE